MDNSEFEEISRNAPNADDIIKKDEHIRDLRLEMNFKKAEELSLENLEDAVATGNHKLMVITQITRALALIDTGHISYARDLLESAITLADSSGFDDLKRRALLGMARILRNDHEYILARKASREALEIARETGLDQAIIPSLNSLGLSYTALGEFEEALKMNREALQMARNSANPKYISAALGNLANTYTHLDDCEKAQPCYKEQIRINRETGNIKGMCQAEGNLGVCYWKRGNFRAAIDHLERNFNIAQELGDGQIMMITKGNLGLVHMYMGDLENAKKFFEDQFSMAWEVNDFSQMADALGHIGALHARTGSFRKALKFALKLHKSAQRLDESLQECLVGSEIGWYYRELGEYEKSESFLQGSIDLSRNIGVKSPLLEALYRLAELRKSENKHQEALELCGEAMKIAEEASLSEPYWRSRVLHALILFETCPDDSKAALQSMLEENPKDRFRASILFELFNITGNTDYRDEAIGIYKKLLRNSTEIEFRQKLEELTGSIGKETENEQ